jgi:hypothetical protein
LRPLPFSVDDALMSNRAVARWRSLVFAATMTLFAGRAVAATAVVTRAGAEVRSAPFAVAPVVGHLDLNATLTADDQPTNGWRRVRLSNGTFGFVADEALRVEPPPASPAAEVKPAAPSIAPAPAPATASLVAARVKVFELTARTQPDASAPVLRVFPNGALLTVAPSAENGWRRTPLPDGQTAYVAEAGLDFGPAPQLTTTNAPVQPLAPAPSPRPRANIYIANLEQLAGIVANDNVVSPMVDNLVTRRQAAIATMIIGGAGGLLLDGLGLFAFTHQDCPNTGGLSPPICSNLPNWTLVITGLGVLVASTAVGLALIPRRDDLFEVVNTWNPRHLDDQLTIESTSTNTGFRPF